MFGGVRMRGRSVNRKEKALTVMLLHITLLARGVTMEILSSEKARKAPNDISNEAE